MSSTKPQSIHVISDGTGETAITLLRAAMVQFPDSDFRIHRHKNVRAQELMERLIEGFDPEKCLIIFTMASKKLRNQAREICRKHGLTFIDLLGPLLESLGGLAGSLRPDETVGALRQVDDNYFRRIAALEYTVKHDDGKCLTELDQADIVIVGISRTSKTPLSIFLSHKGFKVVNIPLVMHQEVPQEVFEIDQKKIVALTIDEDSLRRIRKKRLQGFGQDPNGEYASIAHILKEIHYAEEIYKRNRRWPVINVTDRSLEDTAAEVLRIITSRNGTPPGVIL